VEQQLYLKMRPKTFSEFLGNHRSVELASTLTRGAVLIHGPFGCGKSSLAHLLAERTYGRPFPLHGQRMDNVGVFACSILGSKFRKKDLESLNGYQGRRVIIIDEAQELSTSLQTALHPVVECDWGQINNLIILCTTELKSITPALRSRCVPIQLSPLQEEDIEELVERGCREHGMPSVPADLLPAIRRYFTVRPGVVAASPRLILNAVDLVAAGVPPHSAVEFVVGAVRA
jgi:putative ATPase